MKPATAAGLLLMLLSTAGCRQQVEVTQYEAFRQGFGTWAKRYNPTMGQAQADELASALWAGTAGRLEIACHVAGVAVCESSLQVRKWQARVKQNKDYLGAHNEVHLCELRAQGWIESVRRKGCRSRTPRCLTPEARDWLAFLSQHPEVGTLLATLWYCRLLAEDGGNLERTTRRWKCGGLAFTRPVSVVSSLEYWQRVRNLAAELMMLCAAVNAGHE
jgi:hypothetical protein